MINDFSNDILSTLFLHDENNCLQLTESYCVEYKKSLNIDSDFLRTINGLANNKGGYIIFGVKPDTRELVGLNEQKLEYYNTKIDSEDTRARILLACQPNIEYKHCLYILNGKNFVVFYVPESNKKPHVFMSNGENIVQGDIFYRYNDSIKKIQYAELSAIIEEKRKKEQDKWMRFLGEIAKIGLDNVLIIDAKNGKMISTENYEHGIMLEESILSKLKFIYEGCFNEISGDPTLKIVGNIEVANSTGTFSLSSKMNTVLDTNKTHPYRVTDIMNKLKSEGVKTKDGIKLSVADVSYHRAWYYIVNKKLNVGIDNIYIDNATGTKKYSEKVYNEVKVAFENMTLEEIMALKKEAQQNTSKEGN